MAKSLKTLRAGTRVKFNPAAGHTIAFQAGGLSPDTVDIFGKIISSSPITGLPGGHQLAQIYGYRERDRCFRLPAQLQLSLPSPTGLADGCGWDPAQFVVWKSVPKSLMAVQVQTDVKSVHDALFSPATASATSQPTVDDILHQWLTLSVPGQPIPNVDQLQVAWKDFGSGGAYSSQEQQNLANLINRAFSPQPRVVAANLPATLTVAQLKQNLHRSA